MIPIMNNSLFLPSMIASKAIRFSLDPDTGLVHLTVGGEIEFYNPILQQKQTREWEQVIGLPMEISRALLSALPALQSLLEKALKGPTKPSSLQ